ncbi:hydrogenase expression protein HypF, partial [Actinacidiphila alni]|uniref:hydrogenase expression protein HypF n=1 Tax=Actinacidiphila alni TaxID=380248 RepID=UPI0033E7218F
MTKLHIPAGKAVALAAMPTAVLMGMGFTPHFAQADEMPKGGPYKPGPCVTQSDTPSPSASKSATDGKAKDDGTSTSKTDQGGKSGQESPKPTTSPGPDPTTSPQAPKPTETTTAPSTQDKAAAKATPSSTPSATPSPTKSVNPWDPLGLGDLVTGLLGGGKTPTTAPTTQAPTPAPTTAKPTPSSSPSASAPAKGDDPVGTVGKTVKDTVDGVTSGADKAAKDTKDALDAAKDKATPSPTDTAGTKSSDGTQGYPCPTYDAKALADADVEQGIPLLPDTPWVLKTTKLTLHGLSYHGIVKVKTHSGAVKDVLKFTVSGIDIDNLHQIVDGPHGTKTNVEAAKGSTSKFTGGTVTLYTESLSGNLLGLIPITFTPKAPPPLTLPELFFTNATVIQAAQFGGNLHVPGMHIYGTPNQPYPVPHAARPAPPRRG